MVLEHEILPYVDWLIAHEGALGALPRFFIIAAVLGLLALVMFLALPALQNLLEGSLQREVRRLSGVVRLLRNEAVLTNSRFRLMFDLDKGEYRVEQRDEFGDYEQRDDPKELRPHAFPSSFDIKDLVLFGEVSRAEPETVVPIIIDSSGYVDPFLLHFSDGAAEYTLRVTGFTGRIDLVEGYVDQ